MPKVEVTHGEIVDKFTILKIKSEYLKNQKQQINVQKEIGELETFVQRIFANSKVKILSDELYKTNLIIWNLMEALESNHANPAKYVSICYDVISENRKRSFLKKEIDVTLGSNFHEEKSYFDKD